MAFPSPGIRGGINCRRSAEAGFHAVACDMRGYGQTDRPEAIDQYTLFHLVGDVVGLLDALGEEHARLSPAMIGARRWRGTPL